MPADTWLGDWPVFVHTQNHVAPAAWVALDV